MEILLGCGINREKKIQVGGSDGWRDLVTVDINPDVKPDIVHDLMKLPLPFDDDSADEMHAFDVMEHLGQQGDWRWFFAQWSDIWRVLKPGGIFCGISPSLDSRWLWGDPGHTRVVQIEHFTYLHQPSYDAVGVTPLTDYRFVYKADFNALHLEERDGKIVFVLQAVKPSRCTL